MAAKTIATADKAEGDLFRYTEYNEIKEVVNDHATLLDQDNPLNKPYHGIYAAGALSFNSTSHVLTVASGTNSYYYLGELYSTTAAISCDLDSTAVRDNSSNTFADNVLYYFYFKDATGTLYWSDAFWNLLTMVPVATVFWNGTSGAIASEKHNYNRDLRWHMWAHLTIGCRYGTGSSLTYPNAANDASLQIETGTYYDEDLTITTGQCTTMRCWYKASANVYTFADYSLPYPGSSGDPYWLDTDDYTLKSVADTKYVNMWVYASGDVDRPIYVIPTHASDPYNTVALARAEAPPNLASFNMNAEIKLIYRFLYKGDGEFQEYTDYRLSQPLPSGGVPTPSAGSVSFTPTGNIAATTVQTALEEVDSEKASLTGTETLTNKRITKRVTPITSNANPTINTDNCDCVTITAQAEAIASMTTNLSGSPSNFDKLIIRIKDDGTARAITWGTGYEAKGVALPTTTVLGKVLTLGFIYDSVTSKWGCVASAQET